MPRRFSDIKRGERLNAARLALQNYTPSYNPGTGQPRNLDSVVFIKPFTIDVAVDEVCSAKAYNQGYTTLNALINASTVAEVTNTLGANTLANIPNFRAARVTWFRNATRIVTTPLSKFTNQEYLKYQGTSYSCPFGATADTDDLIDSFLDVKARILAVPNYAVSRVSLVREKIGIEAS